MAEKRMFSKQIVLSDAFLDMPPTTRCLYFTLSMLADDEGFVNSPRSIMRQCGASDDDMRLLLAKKFCLIFESGVIVIKHWRMNNYLRGDRFTETKYTEERSQLVYDKGGTYHMADTCPENTGVTLVYQTDTQYRVEENSIDKNSVVEGSNYNVNPDAPTLSDIKIFIQNNGLTVNAEKFFHHYQGQGWLYKGQPMDWRNKLREWAAEDASKPAPKGMKTMPMANYSSADIDLDALRANLERI